MLHKWLKTEKTDSRGRPVWKCENPGCKVRLAVEVPPQNLSCEVAGDPTDLLARFESAEVPCKHRSDVETVTVSLCGTCSRDIERATCELFKQQCTVAGHIVEKVRTLSCLQCEQRTTS